MTSTASAAAPKQRSSSTPQTSGGDGELSTLTALLKAEAAQLKAATAALKAAKRSSSSRSSNASGRSSSKSSGSGSDGGGAATAILQTTSTQLIVTVDLDASKQSEAKLGRTVTVEMPAGNTVDGSDHRRQPGRQSALSGSGSGSAAGPGAGAAAAQLDGAGHDRAQGRSHAARGSTRRRSA